MPTLYPLVDFIIVFADALGLQAGFTDSLPTSVPSITEDETRDDGETNK